MVAVELAGRSRALVTARAASPGRVVHDPDARCLRGRAIPTRRASRWKCRRSATRKSGRGKDVCNSIQNAGGASVAPRLVHITHPFHPLSGRQLACVGERYNRSGRRLLLQVDEATVCSVPPQWTDLVAPDLELVIGEQRALFRVADLRELARVVEQLSRQDAVQTAERT